MATEPRFRFDFADLRPKPELRVVAPRLQTIPGGATLVPPASRPPGLDVLPAYFTAAEPLHVLVSGRDVRFGSILAAGLTGLLAAAGAEQGLEVQAWPGGFAVGPAGFRAVPAAPHACLCACELSVADVRAAAALARTAPGPVWLVLSRDVPQLDPTLGLSADPFAELPKSRRWRLAELDRAELVHLGRGEAPSLGSGDFSRRCRRLAAALVAAYREALP